MRQLLGGLWDAWSATDAAVQDLSRQPEQLAKKDEACRRPMTVPGVGALFVTAMVAAVAAGSAFAPGRDCAAWRGLVAQRMSTRGKTRLGGITSRGNAALRRMFLDGARSFRLNGDRGAHRIGAGLDDLDQRTQRNVATVALANKPARIARSVLRGGEAPPGGRVA